MIFFPRETYVIMTELFLPRETYVIVTEIITELFFTSGSLLNYDRNYDGTFSTLGKLTYEGTVKCFFRLFPVNGSPTLRKNKSCIENLPLSH